jgi:hypothetical protein
VSLAALQPLAWCAAFWTAVWLYTRRAAPARPLRFALALALGAALAHAGWLLLHAPAVWPALRARPAWLLDPSVGACVLFVPLGLLAVERSPAAFASLPLALAVARLGCLAAGCCGGTASAAPWAFGSRHPTALYEIAGLVALHQAASRAASRRVAALVLGGIGTLRLLVDPLRARPPLGAPLVEPELLAAAWIVFAAGWRLQADRIPPLGRSQHAARAYARQPRERTRLRDPRLGGRAGRPSAGDPGARRP